MALVFNPFTGNFDNVMASSSDMSFSGGSLNVNGDITLDSGGAFTTTVQAVTPTANRTISFPDQTGTVGLVSGATGNIQYNSSGALEGSAKLNTELDWTSAAGTYTGLKVNVDDGAGGAPLGSGKLLDLQKNGTSRLTVNDDGSIQGPNTSFALKTFGTNNFDIFVANNRTFQVGFSVVKITRNHQLTWSSSSTDVNVGIDTGIKRYAAGVVAVTNGSSGTGYLKQTPVLTSALPSAATVGAGTRGFVSDAGSITFNLPIGTGTGTPAAATTIPVFSDGSVWKAG